MATYETPGYGVRISQWVDVALWTRFVHHIPIDSLTERQNVHVDVLGVVDCLQVRQYWVVRLVFSSDWYFHLQDITNNTHNINNYHI